MTLRNLLGIVQQVFVLPVSRQQQRTEGRKPV